jgi:hypothetical protein
MFMFKSIEWRKVNKQKKELELEKNGWSELRKQSGRFKYLQIEG